MNAFIDFEHPIFCAFDLAAKVHLLLLFICNEYSSDLPYKIRPCLFETRKWLAMRFMTEEYWRRSIVYGPASLRSVEDMPSFSFIKSAFHGSAIRSNYRKRRRPCCLNDLTMQDPYLPIAYCLNPTYTGSK